MTNPATINPLETINYINGEFVPASQAKISVFDRAVRYGDAVFDTERTINGKIFKLRQHLERLYRSLHVARLDPGLNIDELAELSQEVVRRNEHQRAPNGDWWVTQRISRGDKLNPTDEGPCTVILEVRPILFHSYAKLYETGANIAFPSIRSYSPESLDPKLKHSSRLNFVLADIEVKQTDPSAYPVLLDVDGNIAEGIGFNFFLVTNGVIRTPKGRGILEGVSRATVKELAAQLDIPCVEEDLQPYHAYTANEVFLSTTSYCVMPVAKVNGNTLRYDVPGPITKQLLAAWGEMVDMDIVGQAMSHLM